MKEIIIGIHSIVHAIKNLERTSKKIYATNEGKDELAKHINIKDFPSVEVQLFKKHNFQETSKRLFEENDFKFQRITSGVLLEADPLEFKDPSWLFDLVDKKHDLKILCLDQVTDAYNAAAIMRTAAFFEVDAVVLPIKGNFGISPGFSRISSGSLEHVPIVKVSNLSKLISGLLKREICVVGFSEHATKEISEVERKAQTCLVMGAEDVGLSHAVSRSIENIVALKTNSEIKSLNVSVASAVAMQLFF